MLVLDRIEFVGSVHFFFRVELFLAVILVDFARKMPVSVGDRFGFLATAESIPGGSK